jgi:hypothetical protein
MQLSSSRMRTEPFVDLPSVAIISDSDDKILTASFRHSHALISSVAAQRARHRASDLPYQLARMEALNEFFCHGS